MPRPIPQGDLEYLRLLVTTVLLLLAVPLVLHHLWSEPKAAAGHVAGAVMK